MNSRETIRILPIHTWWTHNHQHGATGQMHAPDVADFTNDYNFLTWKYAAVLATTGGMFAGPPTISPNVSVYCGLWPFGTYAYACTTGASVEFGTSTFTSTENQAASIIGHELIHASGVLSECTAFTWELDRAADTGIFPCDNAYFQNTLTKKISACDD